MSHDLLLIALSALVAKNAMGGIFTRSPEERCLDLDAEEKSAARALYSASRENSPEKFDRAKLALLSKMRVLFLRLNATQYSSLLTLRTYAKLINFQAVLRDNGVTPQEILSYMDNNPVKIESSPIGSLNDIFESAVSIRASDLKGLAEGGNVTAQQFIKYASLKKEGGQTYLDYIEKNLRSIMFVLRLKDHIKISPCDELWGVEEEVSRTGIFDTYSENNNCTRELWLIASFMVHGAAHMEYFHEISKVNGRSAVSIIENELHAWSMQLEFLKDLQKASKDPSSGISFNAADTTWLQKNIEYIEGKIIRRDFRLR